MYNNRVQNGSKWDNVIDGTEDGSENPSLYQRLRTRSGFWKRLFKVTILASYFFILMEWLFLATMPSFMSIMSLADKLRILLISGLAFSAFWLVVLAGFILLDMIAVALRFSRVTPYLGTLIPTLILATLALLLVDNFTYTLFKFGISTSTGAMRGVYAGLFCLLGVYFYYQSLKILGIKRASQRSEKTDRRLFAASLILLAVSMGIALTRLDYTNLAGPGTSAPIQQAKNLPNIILLGSDGLDADHLSVYGYRRNTTPQLAELARTSLVAENAFTNAGNTAGSVISILTSKLPTQTRVLYPPNILSGVDSYQHLPGLLKGLGYQNYEIGVPYYVDAYNYNLQNGFDVVNDRALSVGKLGDLARRLGYDEEVYFSSRLTWKISDRLRHIFYIQEMQNPFDIVTEEIPSIDDGSKINQLGSILDHAETPVFIHIHLLGTHGGMYEPPDQLFSIGKDQKEPWMDDFYDDTLRAFDSYLGELIYHLKGEGNFDNTILIIYSDHNKAFKVNERIPLIMHFPGGEYAGRITGNVENLDIAPTIADYLGLPVREWMQGVSLIQGEPGNRRMIFSSGTNEMAPNEENIAFLDASLDKPPFYQFSYINVIACQNWYTFDLNTFAWSFGTVPGYVDPCEANTLPTMDEIKQAVYDRLRTDGFEISSLP